MTFESPAPATSPAPANAPAAADGCRLDLPAASAGVRAQWTRSHGTWPSLLEALASAPRALSGVLAMRAVAHGPARAYFDRFQNRLCELWGVEAPRWPAGFGEFTSRPGRTLGERPRPSLPRLAPEQALLLAGPLATLPLPSARVLARGLETCFGSDAAYAVRDDALCRCLRAAVPQTWRATWERGVGLDPPQVFLPPAQLEISRLVEALAAQRPSGATSLPSTLALPEADQVTVVVAVAVLELAATDSAAVANDTPLPQAHAA